MTQKDRKTEKKNDVLVKIDKEIYEKIRKRVEQDRVNFPSIKNFVEKAVAKIIEADEFIREKIVHHHNEISKKDKEQDKKSNDKDKSYNLYKHIPGGVG